jgi:hypothetical protein
MHSTEDLTREMRLIIVWGFSEDTHMWVLGRDRFLVTAARMPDSFAYGLIEASGPRTSEKRAHAPSVHAYLGVTEKEKVAEGGKEG